MHAHHRHGRQEHDPCTLHLGHDPAAYFHDCPRYVREFTLCACGLFAWPINHSWKYCSQICLHNLLLFVRDVYPTNWSYPILVLLYGNLGCRPVSGPTPLLLTSVQFAYDWAVSLTFSLGPITNCEAARVWDQVVQTRLATVRFSFSFLDWLFSLIFLCCFLVFPFSHLSFIYFLFYSICILIE